jgi:hypothetical protein
MNDPIRPRLSGHDLDRRFLAWVRSTSTTRGALVVAREKAMREWQWVVITRELERREGSRA